LHIEAKQAVAPAGRAIFPFVALGACLGVTNLLVPRLLSSGGPLNLFFLLTAAAALCAQVSLVATWGVFSGASFPQRLVRCALLGLTSYLCLVGGLASVAFQEGVPPGDSIPVVLFLLLSLPLLFFAVQLPLLAARVWLGWRIVNSDSQPPDSHCSALTLKDTFVATAAGCVALALPRLSVALVPLDEPGNEMLTALMVVAGIAVAASLFVLLPLTFFAFWPEQTVPGAAGVVCWSSTIVALIVGAASLLRRSLLSDSEMAAVAWLFGAYTGLMLIGVLATRAQGYRLRWRSRRAQ
jgi:hypothetical protein